MKQVLGPMGFPMTVAGNDCSNCEPLCLYLLRYSACN